MASQHVCMCVHVCACAGTFVGVKKIKVVVRHKFAGYSPAHDRCTQDIHMTGVHKTYTCAHDRCTQYRCASSLHTIHTHTPHRILTRTPDGILTYLMAS
jgi:hypothetical protein